ncbi:MAG: pseudoazurin [Paracoccus sp. (in: a-proteobacteria)]|uniref:pseudoazurin n=1 Tax=Paracoccus sp. TaxID=267 RepID=UPI0026E01A13|nr:pseudoazurin [Paracoccus sp. (in: a-proteobacteria)]MDO5630250.1 pseudoazurin [Paracoccus sp. (in: a-proteobacteria)]
MKHALIALALMASPALAEMHKVQMFNRNEHGPMIYDPQYLRIAPGDTVKFLATQPSHNAATIDGGIPEGAAPFRGNINEEIEVTLTESGHYFIKCTPHYAMGMVMLIEVTEGEAARPELPEGMPARAVQRFDQIIDAAYDAEP